MGVLASVYALISADLTQLDRGFSVAIQKAQKSGGAAGSAFNSALKSSLANGAAFGSGGMAAAMGLEGAGTLLDRIKGQLSEIGRVGGVDYAAQIQKQTAAYTKLFNSASLAKNVIKEVQKNSSDAGVSSLEQLEALRKFNALPVSKERLPSILRTVTDTSAAYGFQGAERRRLIDNIGDIYGNGFDKAQSNQFQMLGLNVEKTLGMGLGKTLKNEAAAIAEARKLTPVQQGDAFVKGLEKQFGGLGKEIASTTFLGRLDQAKELFAQAGEASGALAITLAGPFVGGLVAAAGAVKALNDATGGGFGLVGMAVAGGAVLYQTARVGLTAWGTLKLLNNELTNLSKAGGVAAVIQGAAGGGAPAATRSRFSLMPTQPAPTGVGGALLGAGTGWGALAATGIAFGIPLAASAIGGGYKEGSAGATRARNIAESSASAAIAGGLGGAIVGALLGSLAGGVGALPGAYAGYTYGTGGGAVLGALFGAGKSTSTNPASDPVDKLDKAAGKLDEAAVAIKNANAVGGGRRVASALQSLEAQYALQGAF